MCYFISNRKMPFVRMPRIHTYTRTFARARMHTNMNVAIFQSSDDGNISISILSFKPTREDNGKVLICRAINEVLKHSIKETTLKLNVYCKYLAYFLYIFTRVVSNGR